MGLKPTVFFSHSSKDKDLVMTIKDKLDYATGGVIDIFMSSDGQSIPFGTNWIHKVEEGLKIAKLMIVFITPNSISSGWIYFEAGYAYSKGIKVVPIGIGVDITELKAPLNLLQGFNITSTDALNNLITIINESFDYRIGMSFNENDYKDVTRTQLLSELNTDTFSQLVSGIESKLVAGIDTATGEKKIRNLKRFYEKILEYLDSNHFQYSVEKTEHMYTEEKLVTTGIRISYKYRLNLDGENDFSNQMNFYISPLNFMKSFDLFINLLRLTEDVEVGYVLIKLKKQYGYTTSSEDVSSILSNFEEFESIKGKVNGYFDKDLNLKFYVFKVNNNSTTVASIVFEPNHTSAENVINLINKLSEIGFIFEN